MRWVKTAVVIVIVSAIIPTIIMTINKLTGGYTRYKEHEIIITKENINETVYELYNLVKLEEYSEDYLDVTNLLYIEYEGEIINVEIFRYNKNNNEFIIKFIEDGNEKYLWLNLDDPINKSRFSGDYIRIVLYDEIVVEPPLSPIEIILISLIPLILVSSLLIYQYKELKIRKE